MIGNRQNLREYSQSAEGKGQGKDGSQQKRDKKQVHIVRGGPHQQRTRLQAEYDERAQNQRCRRISRDSQGDHRNNCAADRRVVRNLCSVDALRIAVTESLRFLRSALCHGVRYLVGEAGPHAGQKTNPDPHQEGPYNQDFFLDKLFQGYAEPLEITRFNRRIDIFVFCVVYDNRAQREYSQHQAGGIDSAQQQVNAEVKPFSTVNRRESHAGEDNSQKRCDQAVPHIILGNGYNQHNRAETQAEIFPGPHKQGDL